MGVVYAATTPEGRWVAVKVIRPELAADPAFRNRFSREAELLSRIRSPCIASVLDFDTRADQPWLATEYLSGPTLSQEVLDNGPLPLPRARAVAVSIAEAVATIHAAGVVHRDLKPANVILAPDGPRVLDFGIARTVDGTSLTRTGGVVGSPGWMSPERFRGCAGPESDVFGWGGLVVYAMTGRPPFGTGSAEELMFRLFNEEPDTRGVPGELRGIVTRSMAKNPAKRPTATELVRRLSAGTGLEPTSPGGAATTAVPPVGRDRTSPPVPGSVTAPPTVTGAPGPAEVRRRAGRMLGAAAAAVLLVGGVGGWSVGDGDGPGPAPVDPGHHGEPLNLGILIPMTGDMAVFGPPEYIGAELATAQINAAGGVLGQDVPDIVLGDEGGDPYMSTASANELMAEGVSAIIGPTSPEMARATWETISKSGTVHCSASDATADMTTTDNGGLYFRTTPTSSMTARALARKIDEDGHREVVVITHNDDQGGELTYTFLDELGALGVQSTSTSYPAGTLFSSEDIDVLPTEVTAVVVDAPEKKSMFVSGLLDAGFVGDQIYLTGGVHDLNTPSEELDGVTGIAPGFKAPEFEQRLLSVSQAELLSGQFDPSVPGGTEAAAHVFDCVTTIALAAEAAGDTAPAAIADHMAHVADDGTPCTGFAACSGLLRRGGEIDYQGVSGPIAWDDNGDLTAAGFEISRWDGEDVESEYTVVDFGS
ncbi:ABC-type branched-subunit amino acid transport system substrate-binding protein [Nocardiopsis arvandica]|uniref:ABC-type branched-subunit amino acid transport system substrate-binding protein n=2 Tax=Nocardiopsis sinuspersici TaxID=501010 RepID=A0A7Y9X9G2_9ACTN|nr:ABC-type branched-subunit amino acid transport system substrate-binding protein [Nocardiopsis sinuspersici]